MAALLVGLSFVMGPIQMLKLYGVPYWVNHISPLHIFLHLRNEIHLAFSSLITSYVSY